MPRHKSVGGRKSVKTKKVFVKKAKPIYVSDDDIPDETADSFYKDDVDLYHDKLDRGSDSEVDEGIPEVTAARKEAVYDFTDSEDEEEMEQRLKKIEANIRRHHKGDSSESEEEEDEDEVKVRAWGKKRDDFYGADVSTKVNIGVSSDEDEAEAVMEEKEARKMQQKMALEISEADFGLDMFTDAQDMTSAHGDVATDLSLLEPGAKSSDTPEVVHVDLSKMSQKEKERVFKQLYPEYSPIFTEFKRMLRELKDKLWPILNLRTKELLPDSPGIKLLGNKCKLMELFVQCALFYFLLVSEREATKGHPVFGRMLQLQKLIKSYDELEGEIVDEIEFVLHKVADGKEDEILNGKKLEKSGKVTKMARVNGVGKVNKSQSAKVMKKVKSPHTQPTSTTSKSKKVKCDGEKLNADKPAGGKKVKIVKKRMQDLLKEDDELEMHKDKQVDMTTGEKEALEYYDMMRKRHRAGEEQDLDDSCEPADVAINDVDEVTTSDLSDAKRAITEEMQKNRGLTAKRPKHLKNPRIKNKLKFQRKKKIHKTIVPQVLTEVSRYSGEVGGIRAGRVRSVALS